MRAHKPQAAPVSGMPPIECQLGETAKFLETIIKRYSAANSIGKEELKSLLEQLETARRALRYLERLASAQ